MPIDFDFEQPELQDEEEQLVSRAISRVMDDNPVDELPEEELNDDAYLDEVESRLEVATYFRLLLNDSLFKNGTKAAKIVEKEVKTFVKERLALLLNIKRDPVIQHTDFSVEEVAILKMFISELRKKPSLASPKEAPLLNDKSEPSIAKKEMIVPVLNKVQGPATSLPVEEKRPQMKAKPGRKPVVKEKDAEYTEGEIIEENGRNYKIQYVDKPDGRKMVKIDVTKPKTSSAVVPMATGAAATMAMALSASASLASGTPKSGDSFVQTLVQNAVKTQQ